jgi:hypothetical protein
LKLVDRVIVGIAHLDDHVDALLFDDHAGELAAASGSW